MPIGREPRARNQPLPIFRRDLVVFAWLFGHPSGDTGFVDESYSTDGFSMWKTLTATT
jgi:hypothetical protein